MDYGILSAEKAQRRWANNDALSYFTDALRRLDTMSDTEPNRLRRIDAVTEQAEVKFALGRHAEHIEALDAIRGMVDGCGDPRRRATWHYWTGFLHSLTGGRPELVIEHCRVAADLAASAGLDQIGAIATSCLAQIYTFVGMLKEAVEAGERALEIFELRDNFWWASRTLWHLSVAANGLGEWDASLDYCRRALAHGVALDDLRLKAVGWLRMGSAHIQQGNLPSGLECCEQALALAPIPYDAAMARAARGYAEIKAGRIEAGIAELSDVVAWSERSKLRYTHLHQALWLAEGHLRRGDRVKAGPLIEAALNTSRSMGYLHFEGRACWLMSDCLAAEAPAAADQYSDSAMRILERVGARNDLAKAMVTRAELRRNAGDVAAARRLLDQACAIFQALGTLDEPARAAAVRAALTPDAT